LLLADEDAFRAGDGERLAGFDVLAEHGAILTQREGWNGLGGR
jgi:hypothetical protein